MTLLHLAPLLFTVHCTFTKMTTLQLPLSHTPPYALLSLALFKNSQVQWQEASELSEPTYGDVKGVEAVRAELEKGLPGKEVCTLIHLHEMWI
jgi:hypothetical protein